MRCSVLEISCNRKISPPWTEKVPTELQTTALLRFSVHTLPAQERDTAGHTFPPSGTRHMAGHCTGMKDCHGLLLGLGIERKASILTLVLRVSPLDLLWNDTWVRAYCTIQQAQLICHSCLFKPLFLVKMPFKKRNLDSSVQDWFYDFFFWGGVVGGMGGGDSSKFWFPRCGRYWFSGVTPSPSCNKVWRRQLQKGKRKPNENTTGAARERAD